MSPHPVQFHVDRTPVRRVQVLVRLVLLTALGAIGCSSVYWLLYLALPAVAALLLSRDGAEGYRNADAPVVLRALRWLASAYAYLWLLTDDFPSAGGRGSVELTVDVGGAPTVERALLRLLTTLPALCLLAILSLASSLLWIVGAVAVLVRERVPTAISDFLAMTIRYQFRLVAYHLSLVDAYPTLVDSPLPHSPRSSSG